MTRQSVRADGSTVSGVGPCREIAGNHLLKIRAKQRAAALWRSLIADWDAYWSVRVTFLLCTLGTTGLLIAVAVLGPHTPQ